MLNNYLYVYIQNIFIENNIYTTIQYVDYLYLDITKINNNKLFNSNNLFKNNYNSIPNKKLNVYFYNWTTLIATLMYIHVLLNRCKTLILQKPTKVFLITIKILIFVLIPFIFWNEFNLNFKTFLPVIFIITNIWTCLTLRRVFLESIFDEGDDYYNLNKDKHNITWPFRLIYVILYFLLVWFTLEIWISIFQNYFQKIN